MKGAIAKAQELLAYPSPTRWMPQQFENPANTEIHIRDYGRRDLLNNTKGEVDVFISAVGTGGTITGVGQVFETSASQAGVKVIAVEPENSPVLSGGQPGPPQDPGHRRRFRPQDPRSQSLIDEVVTVGNQTAFDIARLVARSEGIPVGISSRAAVAAAIEIGLKPEYAWARISSSSFLPLRNAICPPPCSKGFDNLGASFAC